MPLWDRLRDELDRAGRVAQSALDEGRLRLDLLRARQSADRFAQRLGYAVHHAREAGTELSTEEFAAHSANITAAEAEIARIQTLTNEAMRKRKGSSGPPAKTGPADSAPPAGSTATSEPTSPNPP
jgi:hypothetical protein